MLNTALTGDPHNFGRRVQLLSDGTIHKPRTIAWEWLFLSSQSPLRKLLCDAFEGQALPCPFDLFADVSFSPTGASLAHGRVERVFWEPDRLELTVEVSQKIGSVIGLLSWFGIGDLHEQNLAFGRMRASGRPICMPLDIECIFDDYQLPSQTLLVAAKGQELAGCGLRSLYPLIENSSTPLQAIAAIGMGYVGSLDLLDQLEAPIGELIGSLAQADQWPIRVILRDTSSYPIEKDFNANDWSPPLLPSEIEQLRRKDIPYFFRSIESRELAYFTSPEHATLIPVDELSTSRFPRLANIRELKKSNRRFAWANRQTLLEAGLLQLTRGMLPANIKPSTATINDLSIEVTQEQIICDLGNSKNRRFQCKR